MVTADTVSIDHLGDFPQFVPVVARWGHEEWGFIHPEETLGQRVERMRARSASTSLPRGFVARDGGTPAGTASLVAHDLPSRQDLTPWLASLYVAPEFRSRGIAARLIQAVRTAARDEGFDTLYLYTFTTADYYRARHWSDIGDACVAGRPVTLMSCPTTD